MYSKRQSEIIRYLSEVKFAKVEQLAEVFKVSVETIRRDLMELEKDSSIKRVRGGAVYNNLRAQEMEFERKLEKHQTEKYAIAKLACDYINDGDAIVMSNGTANLALARCLVERKENLTVITNSPDIAMVLNENKSSSVYLTAGHLRKHNKSLVGSMCWEALDNFRVDKTILSIDGISIKDGVTEYNTEEAAVLRKMIEIGQTRMILCEFSKFSEVALNKVCSAKMLDYVFTDWNISSKEVKAWADINVKVLVAPQSNVEKSWNF